MRTEREMMDIFLGTTCSGRLMLLGDGNRIDLHVQTWDYTLAHALEDSLRQVLLDKDGCLRHLPPPGAIWRRSYVCLRTPRSSAYKKAAGNTAGGL